MQSCMELETYYSSFHAADFQEINELEFALLEAIKYLSQTTHIPRRETRALIEQIKSSMGESALCLSGGVTMAFYHFGVVRALLDADSLPKIISGTSAGAMVASWIG